MSRHARGFDDVEVTPFGKHFEKRREDEIRREVRGFSRWVPADAATPRRLYDILTRDGLPSTLPPP